MKKITLLTVVVGAFVLTACGEKTYTVEEFKADEKLLKQYRSKCKNGELDKYSLNCENSRKVYMELYVPKSDPNAWN